MNALAMGLGVLYPNFKEENPGKIVSGVGGTFCLVLSFAYIIGSLVLVVIGLPWRMIGHSPAWLVVASWIAFAALSYLLGWLPLKFALRRLEKLEI